jgi:hypothetical protein
MKRQFLAALLVAALLVPAIAAGKAVRTRVRRDFTPTATGAMVVTGATSRLLLNFSNTLGGDGVASLKLTPTAGGPSIANGYLYDEDGSLRLRLVLTTAPAAADGSSAITGTGKVLRGRGSYHRARGQMRITGTQSSTGVDTLKFSGYVAQDFSVPVTTSGRGQ